MVTKVLGGVSIGLAIVAALGWGAWWLRGRQIESARAETAGLRRALAVCHRGNESLSAALDAQNAALDKLRSEQGRLQQQYEHAAADAEIRERRAVALADQRAREAELLRDRLRALPELAACRQSWDWLMEVEHGQ